MNPMGESSMNLNFKEKSWHDFTPRKSISGAVDPFTGDMSYLYFLLQL